MDKLAITNKIMGKEHLIETLKGTKETTNLPSQQKGRWII